MAEERHPDDPASVCSRCQFSYGGADGVNSWKCEFARKDTYGPLHPITGRRMHEVSGVVPCVSKNNDGKCPDFERKPPVGGRTF